MSLIVGACPASDGQNLPQIFINHTIRLQGKLLQSVVSTTLLEHVSDCRSSCPRKGMPCKRWPKSSTDLHQSNPIRGQARSYNQRF